MSSCTPSQAGVDRAFKKLHRAPSPDKGGKFPPHGKHEWPALLRMLDRRDPSYRH